MKDKIQTLMNEYEQATAACERAVAECEAATLGLDEQVASLVAQIAEIERHYQPFIAVTQNTVCDVESRLRWAAGDAWWDGKTFPTGKKRLTLDRGAWVQVSERTKREVTDTSAAARFIVEEGIEDTAIRNLTLVNDVVDAVVTIKKAFPGVRVSKTASVSISLPKKKKEA